MENPKSKAKIFHQIRNCLNPIQAFLNFVEFSKEDTKLQEFQKVCKINLKQLEELIETLEKDS